MRQYIERVSLSSIPYSHELRSCSRREESSLLLLDRQLLMGPPEKEECPALLSVTYNEGKQVPPPLYN